MCPGAVSVPVGDEENLYDYVVANDYYDDDIEIRFDSNIVRRIIMFL
eukprot:gene2630-5158_t